jgi:hypothetical protein
MPAHKNVLRRLSVRPAGKRCNCRHNPKHTIVKGEPRFIVKDPGPAQPERGYCAACATEMLDKAQAEIATLRNALT